MRAYQVVSIGPASKQERIMNNVHDDKIVVYFAECITEPGQKFTAYFDVTPEDENNIDNLKKWVMDQDW